MKLLLKAFLAELSVFLLAALALFGSLGTVLWPEAWLFLCIFFGFVACLAIFLSRTNPQLLSSRITIFTKDQFSWDKAFLSVFYACSTLWLVLMALDRRWRWVHLPQPSLFLQALGVILLLGSCGIIFLTAKENKYLSPVVRVQENHEVISTGLYSYVRHPLYSGAFLFYLGVPLLLRSWLGAILAVLFLVLLWIRSICEEASLKRFLPGYGDYMKRVKKRFIPHVW